MTHQPGWYADPQQPAQERYWDGASWTDHHRRPSPMSTPPGFGPGPGYGYRPTVPSTPDGVALSGWWNRVLARLVDTLIVTVGSLPLTGYFLFNFLKVLWDFQRRAFEEAVAGRSEQFDTSLPPEAYKWMLPATAISLLAGFAYEYFFLTRSGATPGKKLAGISVRLREVAGPPPASAVVKRWGLSSAFSLVSMIPLVGSLGSLGALLDSLWPLWDDKKQALHDKVAATNVVLGPQPARR